MHEFVMFAIDPPPRPRDGPDAPRRGAVDGSLADCDGDGEAESGVAHAVLYAETGDGVSSGSLACHGGLGAPNRRAAAAPRRRPRR